MTGEGPATRLYVPAPLAAGAAVDAAPEQAHLLRNVLRLAEGDVVALFNGRDGEWRARLATLGRGRARLEVEARTRAQAGEEQDLWLLFAPVKRARIDLIVEKATELGVSRLVPVITRRTNVERVRIDRLAAHAVEAAEQCGRLTVPAVDDPISLPAMLDGWPDGRALVVGDPSAAAPIAAALASLTAPRGAVMTGPEGGLASAELDALDKYPFVTRARLGPRVLRAETAAVAALTCWQAVRGDWGGAPPPPEADGAPR